MYVDFASLDLISRGRAEVIAGRSAFVEPFALFGYDTADYDALFAEKLGLLLDIRAREEVTCGRPVPPAAAGGRRGAPGRSATAAGLGRRRRVTRQRRTGWPPGPADGARLHRRHARAPAVTRRRLPSRWRTAGHPDQLKVAISTHFHAGADPAKARAVYPYYHEYLRPKRAGGRGFVVSPAAFEVGTGRHGAIMIGSAGEITDKLLDAAKALDLDRIFAQVDWGGLPRDLVGESIARYATEIAPALRS